MIRDPRERVLKPSEPSFPITPTVYQLSREALIAVLILCATDEWYITSTSSLIFVRSSIRSPRHGLLSRS